MAWTSAASSSFLSACPSAPSGSWTSCTASVTITGIPYVYPRVTSADFKGEVGPSYTVSAYSSEGTVVISPGDNNYTALADGTNMLADMLGLSFGSLGAAGQSTSSSCYNWSPSTERKKMRKRHVEFLQELELRGHNLTDEDWADNMADEHELFGRDVGGLFCNAPEWAGVQYFNEQLNFPNPAAFLGTQLNFVKSQAQMMAATDSRSAVITIPTYSPVCVC